MTTFLPVLAVAAGIVYLSRDILHFFQLESYQFHGYFKTLRRQWKRVCLPFALFAGMIFLCFLCKLLWKSGPVWLQVILDLITAGLIAAAAYQIDKLFIQIQRQKKPFVVTARVKRLYGGYAIVVLLFAAVLLSSHLPLWLFLPALAVCAPFLLALGALLMLPVEKGIQQLYFNDARKRLLASPGLIRIGITGSYGKTSVKFILHTILSEKYLVLSMPSSFNTPMGLTRIIRERLEPAHQVFIGEMGARHTKDIRVLCRLVHPQIGILTSVGPQHLDTFKTLENIKNTKYDLIRSLPSDGFAVFSDDKGIVRELWEKTNMPKAIAGEPGDSLWADHIELSSAGSTFDLHIGDRVIPGCQTKLLGKYNIQNIVAACACAVHLGLSDEQIVRGIAKVQPVEHRLQLLTQGNQITVIDDSFNSNPRGSEAALDVLAGFPGRRIIVTPGMVELGREEEEYNRRFGTKMASCVDMAYLVGKKHTKPIHEGLLSAGFAPENVFVCSDLNEAVALLNQKMQKGDVVLYENDLPDHYDEK